MTSQLPLNSLERSKYEYDLFIKAMVKWGKASQMAMLAEECSELSHAVLKMIRGREVNIAEEIADVLLTINQFYTMFEGLEIKVKREYIDKIERLDKRIKQALQSTEE